jgi:hypothetical protein
MWGCLYLCGEEFTHGIVGQEFSILCYLLHRPDVAQNLASIPEKFALLFIVYKKYLLWFCSCSSSSWFNCFFFIYMLWRVYDEGTTEYHWNYEDKSIYCISKKSVHDAISAQKSVKNFAVLFLPLCTRKYINKRWLESWETIQNKIVVSNNRSGQIYILKSTKSLTSIYQPGKTTA